jgi:hypothetical protein
MMQCPTSTHDATDSAAAPCRRLAARVIQQAVKDASHRGQSEAIRNSARTFLEGSSMLYYWCAVAGLDTKRVIGAVAVLTGISDHRNVAGNGSAERLAAGQGGHVLVYDPAPAMHRPDTRA